jgi:ribonucleotide reductase alpha subunit
MRLPFESPKAMELNKDIFETMYFAALESSMELAAIDGPYTSYEGSPMSRGQIQPDLWKVTTTDRWNWNELREKIAKHGVRNSLLLAPMPTASTAQIMGNNESTEPFTSNMYNRRVLAGEFTIVNKYLLRDLVESDLWTSSVRNQIIADRGSIQNVRDIPQEIKDLYKTVWEIKQKAVIDQAADRGAFICQSQSLNIHIAEPTTARLTSMHFYAWKRGLKTGMYYLRTRPKADAIQFTVDQTALNISNSTTSKTTQVSNRSVSNNNGSVSNAKVSNESEDSSIQAMKNLEFQEEPACENCSA